MRAIANLSIIAKLVAVFALVLFAVCGSTFISWRSLGTIEEATRWRDHTYQVLLELDRLTGSMVDRETGLRGYLVSADPAFLEPFNAGAKAYAETLGRLRTLVADNAEQQHRLDALDAAAGQWSRDVAEREIALMRDEGTREQARRIEASGAGKTAMDTVRRIAAAMAGAEAGLLETRARIAEEAAIRLPLRRRRRPRGAAGRCRPRHSAAARLRRAPGSPDDRADEPPRGRRCERRDPVP